MNFYHSLMSYVHNSNKNISYKNQCYYGLGWWLEAIYCDKCGNGYKCRENFMKKYLQYTRSKEYYIVTMAQVGGLQQSIVANVKIVINVE